MLRFEDILEKVESYHPHVDEDLLRRAYVVSAHEHKNQLRAVGASRTSSTRSTSR